ncbi:MAG: hypothetical protein NEA02_02900, partial [Thermoanaerobaculia bacterium]|nr:hypothetical protein [Thermoanaerobaculia bacterium]
MTPLTPSGRVLAPPDHDVFLRRAADQLDCRRDRSPENERTNQNEDEGDSVKKTTLFATLILLASLTAAAS